MKSVHIVCNEIVQCVVQTVHMCFVVLWCKIHCTASLAQMFQRPIVIHANCPHKNHNIVNSLHYTYLVQLLQVVHSTQLSFSVSSIYWARTEMMPIHPKLHIRYLIDGWIDVSLDLFLQIQPTFRSHHFFLLVMFYRVFLSILVLVLNCYWPCGVHIVPIRLCWSLAAWWKISHTIYPCKIEMLALVLLDHCFRPESPTEIPECSVLKDTFVFLLVTYHCHVSVGVGSPFQASNT